MIGSLERWKVFAFFPKGRWPMLRLENQDTRTRWLMINELDNDARAGRLYDSPLLTKVGREDYPSLLRDAILNRDEEWLAGELLKEGRVARSELVGQGDMEREILPETVKVLVAQEFNRLYCRAICRRAIEQRAPYVQVYRAEEVPSPCPEVLQTVLHSNHDPADMLGSLRKCDSLEATLSLPNRQRSGLSLRLPS
jgi:hypothetical protein